MPLLTEMNNILKRFSYNNNHLPRDYWSIYIQYGLNNDITNFIKLNTVFIKFWCLDLISGMIIPYATNNMINIISSLINGDVTYYEANKYIFFALLIINIFLNDLINFYKHYTYYDIKPMCSVMTNIYKKLNEEVFESSRNILDKVDGQKYYEGLNGIFWLFSNTTEKIGNFVTNLLKNVLLLMWLFTIDPLYVIIIIAFYYIIFNYYIPYIIKECDNVNHFELWSDARNGIICEFMSHENPCTSEIYKDNDFTHIYSEIIKKNSIYWHDRMNRVEYLNFIQNIFMVIILTLSVYNAHYDVFLMIIINKSYIFGLFISSVQTLNNSVSLSILGTNPV